MGGALVQLVAYGKENMFLTTDPQITFFKVAYRRHTNFTKEQIPQHFTSVPNFGRNMNCTLARMGDLVGNIFIIVRLPQINIPITSRTEFAWVKKVGFALIKSVNVVISGQQIDKHYGDWLNVWSELTGLFSGPHKRGYKKMIGDIEELTDFSHTKDEYTLYIPLQFWFCRISGLALPIVALQYSDIKINVEFEKDINCYILSPTNSIVLKDDVVGFIKHEYIEQNVDGDVRAGIFMDFDINTKTLYYYKITDNKLSSIPIAEGFDTSNATLVTALEESNLGQQYLIVGKTSNFSAFAQLNSNSISLSPKKINNLKFVDCFLLVDYYFLDDEERIRFSQSRHDYLIDQLFYTPLIKITNTHYSALLTADNPSKMMIWTVQMKYIYDSKDYYNYTDTYQRKILLPLALRQADELKADDFRLMRLNIPETHFATVSQPYDVEIGQPIGKSVVLNSTILCNGNERLTLRHSQYFEHVQQYQHTRFSPQVGINTYSYALYPYAPVQPSGSFNASQIDNIQVKLHLSPIVTANNPALFRGYCLSHNIFRIVNGLGAVVFTR